MKQKTDMKKTYYHVSRKIAQPKFCGESNLFISVKHIKQVELARSLKEIKDDFFKGML